MQASCKRPDKGSAAIQWRILVNISVREQARQQWRKLCDRDPEALEGRSRRRRTVLRLTIIDICKILLIYLFLSVFSVITFINDPCIVGKIKIRNLQLLNNHNFIMLGIIPMVSWKLQIF